MSKKSHGHSDDAHDSRAIGLDLFTTEWEDALAFPFALQESRPFGQWARDAFL